MRAPTGRTLLRGGVALLLAGLVACTSQETPDDDGPETGTPSASPTGDPSPDTTPDAGPDAAPDTVRATLGALDPCSLLDDAGATRARFAEGPHTCEADLGDARVRVEVGVPFDQTARDAADDDEVDGLRVWTDQAACRAVFGVGPGHGVAVAVDGGCEVLPDATAVVAAALTGDVDSRLRTGSDALTACGLLAGAAPDDSDADDSVLTDGAGTGPNGFDHCEIADGAVLARTGLSLDYTEVPFEEMARLVGGRTVALAGQDAVVAEAEQGCVVHTYLWPSTAEGRGEVRTEAILRAASCSEARRATAAVVDASRQDPPAPDSLDALLVTTG